MEAKQCQKVKAVSRTHTSSAKRKKQVTIQETRETERFLMPEVDTQAFWISFGSDNTVRMALEIQASSKLKCEVRIAKQDKPINNWSVELRATELPKFYQHGVFGNFAQRQRYVLEPIITRASREKDNENLKERRKLRLRSKLTEF